MNPTKLILSFLGVSDVRSFLHAGDAEFLEEDAHCLHCPDTYCQQQAESLQRKMDPDYIDLCKWWFHQATPAVKFRALMEHMSLDQIKAEFVTPTGE